MLQAPLLPVLRHQPRYQLNYSGIPQDSCFNALAGWFKSYAELAYISGFVFVAICLCLIIWMCTYQFFCIRENVEYFTAVSATMIV